MLATTDLIKKIPYRYELECQPDFYFDCIIVLVRRILFYMCPSNKVIIFILSGKCIF
jgi:hypothetical protein